MPYAVPPPQGILVEAASGRSSPGPGFNYGTGHPSTTSLGATHPPGAAPPQLNGPSPLATSMPVTGPASQSSSNLPPGAASGPGYPWSTRTLRLYQPPPTAPAATPTSPFPRYGLSVPSYPSHSGHMLLFGGLAHDRAHNDLWSLDVRDCSLQLVKTRGDAPLARIGHVSAIADRVMLVFGGDTKLTETDKQDDGLYILDLRTQEWTRVPVLAGPSGRYGHAACMVGNTFYVHGGHVDGRNLDDLWAFDVSQCKSGKRCRRNSSADNVHSGQGWCSTLPVGARELLVPGTARSYRPHPRSVPQQALPVRRYRWRLPLQRLVVIRHYHWRLVGARVHRLHSHSSRGPRCRHCRRCRLCVWRTRCPWQGPWRPCCVQDFQ